MTTIGNTFLEEFSEKQLPDGFLQQSREYEQKITNCIERGTDYFHHIKKYATFTLEAKQFGRLREILDRIRSEFKTRCADDAEYIRLWVQYIGSLPSEDHQMAIFKHLHDQSNGNTRIGKFSAPFWCCWATVAELLGNFKFAFDIYEKAKGFFPEPQTQFNIKRKQFLHRYGKWKLKRQQQQQQEKQRPQERNIREAQAKKQQQTHTHIVKRDSETNVMKSSMKVQQTKDKKENMKEYAQILPKLSLFKRNINGIPQDISMEEFRAEIWCKKNNFDPEEYMLSIQKQSQDSDSDNDNYGDDDGDRTMDFTVVLPSFNFVESQLNQFEKDKELLNPPTSDFKAPFADASMSQYPHTTDTTNRSIIKSSRKRDRTMTPAALRTKASSGPTPKRPALEKSQTPAVKKTVQFYPQNSPDYAANQRLQEQAARGDMTMFTGDAFNMMKGLFCEDVPAHNSLVPGSIRPSLPKRSPQRPLSHQQLGGLRSSTNNGNKNKHQPTPFKQRPEHLQRREDYTENPMVFNNMRKQASQNRPRGLGLRPALSGGLSTQQQTPLQSGLNNRHEPTPLNNNVVGSQVTPIMNDDHNSSSKIKTGLMPHTPFVAPSPVQPKGSFDDDDFGMASIKPKTPMFDVFQDPTQNLMSIRQTIHSQQQPQHQSSGLMQQQQQQQSQQQQQPTQLHQYQPNQTATIRQENLSTGSQRIRRPAILDQKFTYPMPVIEAEGPIQTLDSFENKRVARLSVSSHNSNSNSSSRPDKSNTSRPTLTPPSASPATSIHSSSRSRNSSPGIEKTNTPSPNTSSNNIENSEVLPLPPSKSPEVPIIPPPQHSENRNVMGVSANAMSGRPSMDVNNQSFVFSFSDLAEIMDGQDDGTGECETINITAEVQKQQQQPQQQQKPFDPFKRTSNNNIAKPKQSQKQPQFQATSEILPLSDSILRVSDPKSNNKREAEMNLGEDSFGDMFGSENMGSVDHDRTFGGLPAPRSPMSGNMNKEKSVTNKLPFSIHEDNVNVPNEKKLNDKNNALATSPVASNTKTSSFEIFNDFADNKNHENHDKIPVETSPFKISELASFEISQAGASVPVRNDVKSGNGEGRKDDDEQGKRLSVSLLNGDRNDDTPSKGRHHHQQQQQNSDEGPLNTSDLSSALPKPQAQMIYDDNEEQMDIDESTNGDSVSNDALKEKWEESQEALELLTNAVDTREYFNFRDQDMPFDLRQEDVDVNLDGVEYYVTMSYAGSAGAIMLLTNLNQSLSASIISADASSGESALKVSVDNINALWEYGMMKRASAVQVDHIGVMDSEPHSHGVCPNPLAFYEYQNFSSVLMKAGSTTLAELTQIYKEEKRTMPELLVHHYAIKLCDMVATLHENGIVHGAVVPKHIIVNTNSDGNHLSILDWQHSADFNSNPNLRSTILGGDSLDNLVYPNRECADLMRSIKFESMESFCDFFDVQDPASKLEVCWGANMDVVGLVGTIVMLLTGNPAKIIVSGGQNGEDLSISVDLSEAELTNHQRWIQLFKVLLTQLGSIPDAACSDTSGFLRNISMRMKSELVDKKRELQTLVRGERVKISTRAGI